MKGLVTTRKSEHRKVLCVGLDGARAMLEILRSFVSFFKSNPRAYERKILEKVGSKMGCEARLLFAKQIESKNLVQRHSNDKEVNFYRMKNGKVENQDEYRFRNRAKELNFARVIIKPHATERALRADLWAVDGFFFSLTFSRAPKVELENGQFKIVTCELLADVMEEREEGVTPDGVNQIEFGNLLSRLAESGLLKNVIAPAHGEETRRFEELWGNKVPSDYLELINESNGFSFNGWMFLGVNSRYIVLPTQNIIVLAECPTRGALGTVDDDPTHAVVFCDYEKQTIEPIGFSFFEALSRCDCPAA